MNDLTRSRPKAYWDSKNPILRSGEFGFEDETGRVKKGDGSTRWSALSFLNLPPWTIEWPESSVGAVKTVAGRVGEVVLSAADISGTFADNQIPASIARDSEVASAVSTRVPTSLVGAASGVASLDNTGKIPQAQMPAVAMTDFLGTVGSQAAMLALTGQRGDWCTRTDKGTDWQLIAEPSSSISSWRERTYPASPVSSVAGRVGSVTLSADDLTDATSVGKAVVRAADAATARTAIGAAPASQLAGHLIRNKGADLPQRAVLDVVGAGATVIDDVATGRSVLTVPGGVPVRDIVRPPLGGWYTEGFASSTSVSPPTGVLRLGLFFLPPGTWDAVLARVETPASGASVKYVGYTIDPTTGQPAAVLFDTASAPATAGGNLIITFPAPLVVPAGGLAFWAGLVNLGPASSYWFTGVGYNMPRLATTSALDIGGTQPPTMVEVSGVTGAAPPNPSVTYANIGASPKLAFRRSA